MKVKGLRWWIIALIGLATVINYIDRSAINILWPYIYKDFGISEADNKNALALLTTFFLVAYALGQTLSGKLIDVIGTRLGMVYSIAGWSISIALHALAKGLASFSVFRFLLGVTEAGNWPGATKSNAEWFPAKERAIAQGLFNAGASLGSVVSAPVIATLYIAVGWQGTFSSIALLGLVWIIPWLIVNKTGPAKHPWITKDEQNYILHCDTNKENVVQETTVYSWKQLLSFKKTWSIITSRFFIDPIWWLFITWLPTFLKEHYQFDIKKIGAFAWFPFLLAALGSVIGGYFSSMQIKKGVQAVKARKNAIALGYLITLSALIAIALLLNDLKHWPSVTIALIGCTLFGFQFVSSNICTLPSDFFNGKNVGTVAGMGGTAAVLGVLVTTWLVPIITKTSYNSFFILAACLVPLSWLSLRFFARQNN
jgi:MFS transporter, ACS family, hexuronate transporter